MTSTLQWYKQDPFTYNWSNKNSTSHSKFNLTLGQTKQILLSIKFYKNILFYFRNSQNQPETIVFSSKPSVQDYLKYKQLYSNTIEFWVYGSPPKQEVIELENKIEKKVSNLMNISQNYSGKLKSFPTLTDLVNLTTVSFNGKDISTDLESISQKVKKLNKNENNYNLLNMENSNASSSFLKRSDTKNKTKKSKKPAYNIEIKGNITHISKVRKGTTTSVRKSKIKAYQHTKRDEIERKMTTLIQQLKQMQMDNRMIEYLSLPY